MGLLYLCIVQYDCHYSSQKWLRKVLSLFCLINFHSFSASCFVSWISCYVPSAPSVQVRVRYANVKGSSCSCTTVCLFSHLPFCSQVHKKREDFITSFFDDLLLYTCCADASRKLNKHIRVVSVNYCTGFVRQNWYTV
jgi:hypothetical protein